MTHLYKLMCINYDWATTRIDTLHSDQAHQDADAISAEFGAWLDPAIPYYDVFSVKMD
jgi:hypothetical protein